MAIFCTYIGDGLSRDGSYRDPSLDWTTAMWINCQSDLSAGDGEYNAWINGPSDFTGQWIQMGVTAPSIVDPPGTDPGLALFGESFQVIASEPNAPLINQTWYYIALTYTAATMTLELFVNAASVGSDIEDLSGMSAQANEVVGSGDTNDNGGIGVAYVRCWQSALTSAQLAAEMASASAVLAANLLADTPLVSPDALGDISGNGQDWSAVGSLVQMDGPLDEPTGAFCALFDCPAPSPGVTYPICRRRRFPLPFEQNKLITIYRIEFLIQSGVSPNAELTARFSRDGGNNFVISRTLTAGASGAFGYRVFTTNLGQGRNWVCELSTSEPYFWALIGCYADIEMGTS